MQYIPISILFELAFLLGSFEQICKHAIEKEGPGAASRPVPDLQRQKWLSVFERAVATKEFRLFLPFTVGVFERLIEGLKDSETTVWQAGELMRDAQRRIADELQQQVHFQIHPTLIELAKQPMGRWEPALAKHPEIKDDVFEAGYCLVCDRWTASVFHLMRVLEHGLRSFALETGIEADVSHENWKTILDQIEKRVRAVEQEPKGPEKAVKLQRWSEMASQFRYFKDAWRNHVSHSRSSFDAAQASSIYSHVRDFTNTMASGGGSDKTE